MGTVMMIYIFPRLCLGYAPTFVAVATVDIFHLLLLVLYIYLCWHFQQLKYALLRLPFYCGMVVPLVLSRQRTGPWNPPWDPPSVSKNFFNPRRFQGSGHCRSRRRPDVDLTIIPLHCPLPECVRRYFYVGVM